LCKIFIAKLLSYNFKHECDTAGIKIFVTYYNTDLWFVLVDGHWKFYLQL